jgi:hypothetical protein
MAMVSEHLTTEEIERLRRAEVHPATRRRTDAHLAVCESCLHSVTNVDHAAFAVNALQEALLLQPGEAPFHLSRAELSSYATNAATPADRIICESHLEICEHCSDELSALSATVPAHSAPTAAQLKAGRFGSWWQAPTWFTPARVAVAIGLVAIIVLAVVLWRQRTTGPATDGAARRGSPALTGPAPSVAPTPKPAELPAPLTVATVKDNDREIRLDQDGKLFGLEGFDEPSQRMVKAALLGEPIAKPPELGNLAAPDITLLGDPPSDTSFSLTAPLGEVVAEQRPTLRWRALNGAASYMVSVYDGNFDRIAQSPPLSVPTWTVSVSLPRGQVFAWEVTAIKDGNEITAPAAPAPRAQFAVLEAGKLNTLRKLEGQKPGSHLVLGLAYARLGLVSSAERQFRQLVNDNPNSPVAKRLLQSVRSWRGGR